LEGSQIEVGIIKFVPNRIMYKKEQPMLNYITLIRLKLFWSLMFQCDTLLNDIFGLVRTAV